MICKVLILLGKTSKMSRRQIAATIAWTSLVRYEAREIIMSADDIPNTPVEPAGDTRPIRFEELLEHEVELIRRANDLLRGIREDTDQPRHPRSSPEPWASVDHYRSHRALMIDGPRGSGKTSLLLTLLAGWQEDWETVAPKSQKEARRFFGDMKDIVRPLKPLDFDPLPPDLPLYGWIIQAFRPLVDWLTNEEIKSSDSERDRSVLPWSDSKRSLDEQWKNLYEMAIVGWGSGNFGDAFQKDLSDFVLDQREQHKNWQQLQDSWQCFLDDLFDKLNRSGQLPRRGLIVLPIDDIDLQVGRDRELLLAIRLLHHPRLVYLLTGDLDHLRENLTLEFLGRMTRLLSFQDEVLIDESQSRARALAHALVNKTLPQSHILEMKKLTPEQVLEWDIKKPPTLLDKLFIGPDISLHQFFEKRRNVLDDGYFLLRRLQQFQERYANVSEPAPPEHLSDFLEMLPQEEDPDEFDIGEVSENRIVIHTFLGPILPVTTRTHRRGASLGPIEVCAGTSFEFYQKVDQETRFVQASPLTLLALDLAASATVPNVYVNEHTPRIQSPQCLAWSIWKSESYETVLSWPSIAANSPIELIERARRWDKEVRKLRTDETWVDRIAFIWICLHLSWLKETDEKLPTPPDVDLESDIAWSRLLQFLEQNAARYSSQWFKTELPLLTAPEYGLSRDIQKELFGALIREDSEETLNAWRASRRKAVANSLRIEEDQAPENWIEIYKSNPIKTGDHQAEPRYLLGEIREIFSHSLWYDAEARSKIGKNRT